MAMSDSDTLLRPSRLQFRAASDTKNGRPIGHFNTYNRGDMNSPHMRLSNDIFPLSREMKSRVENTIKQESKKDSSMLGAQEQSDTEHPKRKMIGKLKNVFSSSNTSDKNKNIETDEIRNEISQLRADINTLIKDKNLSKDDEKETLKKENAQLREILQSQNKKKYESEMDSHYSSHYNESDNDSDDSDSRTRRKKFTRKKHIKILPCNSLPYNKDENLKLYEKELSAMEANLIFGDNVTKSQISKYQDLNNRRTNYLVKKIIADQEENNNPSLAIMPKLRTDNNINIDLFQELKDLKGITLLPLSNDFSIYSFISQFDGYQLSEPEYNMIVVYYLDNNTRNDYLSQYNELPKDTPTKVFLERLIDLKNGSANGNIQNQIHNFKTNSIDIMSIYTSLLRILNKCHPKEMTSKDQDMALYIKIKDYIPTSLLPDYIRQAKNSFEGRRAPDRSALHRYLRLFEEPINMHLEELGGKRHRINMVEVDNSREPQAFNKNSNLKKTPKCEICHKFGHNAEKCFQHTIKGEENLKNAKFCLLCRSKKHLSPECHLYPNSIFIVEGCTHCKENKYYACHPSNNCKGVDRDYALYTDLQKEANDSKRQWTSSLKN